MHQIEAKTVKFAKQGWGTEPAWREVWKSMMSPDVVYHFNSSSEPITGLKANIAFNENLFIGFPDVRQEIGNLLVDGDSAVYRTTIQGTHTGDFLGMPATGRKVRLNDFTLLRFGNGLIEERWYETNLLEMMQQLGLAER